VKVDASIQNAGLLAIIGLLGGALMFHAVPAENREAVSMIIGGCLGVLRGPQSAPQGSSVGQ
jgi:hypothetical protein